MGGGGGGPPAPPPRPARPAPAAANCAPPAAVESPGAPRPPRPPPRPPRATAGAMRCVGMLGSAPCAIRIFMASTSTAYAARQNGVAPSMFSSPQLALPQLLNTKYQGCDFIRELGFAPASSSADIICR